MPCPRIVAVRVGGTRCGQIEDCLDVRTVADRAGHADAVLTMRQYVHAFDAQRKKAAIPLDELLGDD